MGRMAMLEHFGAGLQSRENKEYEQSIDTIYKLQSRHTPIPIFTLQWEHMRETKICIRQLEICTVFIVVTIPEATIWYSSELYSSRRLFLYGSHCGSLNIML